MIDGTAARMLAAIAARANDLLGAYTNGAEPAFADTAASARTIMKSSNPLGVAAADGYFIVDDRGRRAYTHDGDFVFARGALLSAAGSPVYGYAGDEARSRGILSALRADPVDAALQRCRDLRIEADGRVVYTRTARDAATGAARPERVTIGTVALARFPAGTAPLHGTAAALAGPPGTAVHVGVPADGNFAPLATFARDRGTIDVEAALRGLQEAYEAFGALQAAQAARGKIERGALDLIK